MLSELPPSFGITYSNNHNLPTSNGIDTSSAVGNPFDYHLSVIDSLPSLILGGTFIISDCPYIRINHLPEERDIVPGVADLLKPLVAVSGRS